MSSHLSDTTLEAMGILALITRETPAAIAAERKSLRKILEHSASQANAVEKRMAEYPSHLESRLAQLPKELETGLDPSRIAKLLGESLRQCFQQSGLPDAARALEQSCSEVSSVQKQLVSVLREVAHPDIGVIAKVRSANDSLLRSMTTRTQKMDNFLVRLERQVWAFWLPVVSTAALALGFALVRGLPTCDKERRKRQVPLSHSRCQCRKLLRSKSFHNGTQSIIETKPGLGAAGLRILRRLLRIAQNMDGFSDGHGQGAACLQQHLWHLSHKHQFLVLSNLKY
jgi:hypothetical protein